MTFNFWFLTGGKNAASTIQAIQRASGPPDARPRAPLPITDRVEAYMEESQQPVIVAPTSQNLAPRRAPAPRPQNVEITTQRARSVRGSQKGSQKERSRSPQSVSSRVTGVQDLPHPPQDLPPGQWISSQQPISQGVWNTPIQDKVQPLPPGFPVSRPPGQSPSGPHRPFSAFPYNPIPGTSTVIRPSGPGGKDSTNPTPSPPLPPEQTSYVLAAPEVTETVTQNQTEFRAWFRKHVDARFSMRDSMINYLSRLLDVSGYKTEDLLDLRITSYDPKGHETDPGDRKPLHYYVLRVPGFRKRAQIPQEFPPDPQRAAPARGLKTIEHVMITHTSNRGGARGILEEAKIAPSRLHTPESNSFFSLGARKTGANEWDAKELARIIHSTWFMSKQQCSLVFVGIAWGEATSVKEGGEYKCCQLTQDSGTVHHQRAKMWVTNSNSHLLTGLAFSVVAEAP